MKLFKKTALAFVAGFVSHTSSLIIGARDDIGERSWHCDWRDHNTLVCAEMAWWRDEYWSWHDCTTNFYDGGYSYSCTINEHCKNIDSGHIECASLSLCENLAFILQAAQIYQYSTALVNNDSAHVDNKGDKARSAVAELPDSQHYARDPEQLSAPKIKSQKMLFAETPSWNTAPNTDICRVYVPNRPRKEKRSLASGVYQVFVFFPDTMSLTEIQSKLSQGLDLGGSPGKVLEPERYVGSAVPLGSVQEVMRGVL